MFFFFLRIKTSILSMALYHLGPHLLLLFPCSLCFNYTGSLLPLGQKSHSHLRDFVFAISDSDQNAFSLGNLSGWFSDLLKFFSQCHLSASFLTTLLSTAPTSTPGTSYLLPCFFSRVLPLDVPCICLVGLLLSVTPLKYMSYTRAGSFVPCSIPWA